MERNDFKKFATKHLGMNSMVLDDVIKVQSQYLNPYLLEERQLNVTQMDVFSRLMMERILFLGTPINDDIANIIQAQILFLESTDPTKDIQIYVNSPGGSVSAGLGIYDTMQLISCDVATYCIGQCASMGAVLLAAGAPGKRFALPNSRIMIHQPWGGAQGTAADIDIQAKEILRLKEMLNGILAGHCKQTMKKICKDTERDFFMSAEEACDYRLVDKVLNPKKK